jgi:hypothetical protein
MIVGVAQGLGCCECEVEVADFAMCSLSENVNIDKAGCGNGGENPPLCVFGVMGWHKTKHFTSTSDRLLLRTLTGDQTKDCRV